MLYKEKIDIARS